jgi:hypothetical protein
MTGPGGNDVRGHGGIWAVGGILFLATIYFYQDPGWNGNARLALTKAIVEQGTLRIDDYHTKDDWYTGDTSLFEGHYYSNKAPGSSLLAVPLYFLLWRLAGTLGLTLDSSLIKHVLTTTIIGTAFIINGMVMYLIALRIAQDARKAIIATLAVSLGTMLWPYSDVYYGHVLAAVFLSIAFYLLLLMRWSPNTISGGRFAQVGLAMGAAFVTEYPTALIILGLCTYSAYLLWVHSRPRMLRYGVSGAAAAVVPLLLLLSYDFAVYGDLMGVELPNSAAMFHITLDPQFGLFWLSPVLFLTPVGYFTILKRKDFRAEGLLSLFSVAAIVLMNGGFSFWWGGNAFGPRLLIPAIPFFIIPLACIPRRLLAAMITLAIISAAQMLIPLLGEIQINMTYYSASDRFIVAENPFRGFSILYEHGLPLIGQRLEEGRAPWSLGSAVGLPFWASAALFISLEGLLLSLFAQHASGLCVEGNRSPAAQ